MKIALSLALLTGSIFLLGQGCEDKKSEFKPLSGGFGVMAQWVGIDSGPRAELYYKTNDSKPVLIWPFLDGEMYYTNDLFFFGGSIRDEEGKITIQHYFAAQAPGPAIDISDDLLKHFTESNGLDLGIARKKYRPWKAEKVADRIKVFFASDETNTLLIHWEQLSNIIQDVKLTGKQHAMEDPHTVYLKKDY